jgi:hypothetical protein
MEARSRFEPHLDSSTGLDVDEFENFSVVRLFWCRDWEMTTPLPKKIPSTVAQESLHITGISTSE